MVVVNAGLLIKICQISADGTIVDLLMDLDVAVLKKYVQGLFY